MITVRESACGIKQGDRIGSWLVVGHAFSIGKQAGRRQFAFVCQCQCGQVFSVRVWSLRSGRSTKCARCGNSISTEQSRIRRRLKKTWENMVARCHNPRKDNFADYGGRGISVCDEWRLSFSAFMQWALASGYDSSLQLDRKDNYRGYCEDNCRWVSRKQNGNNQRTNIRVSAFGETKTLAEWASDERCMVPYGTLCKRLRRGWPVVDAITKPPDARFSRMT